ncbi:uncharacterized protein BCR38DRAFT_411733 [Pseudomassariella vexata]|uniref:DUF8035 domain-containing protein n=1 Tax=Pseudomassariella vexata TaxID=1141098 RepID=A0A1Y2DN43_9PEZI|nr:uncharacterized protein BCR38DRAFT_411733 [Pseudomassariella vexata]ORY60589.1 hypothetical protein BCR38DRAFT_411733 [Pseudomassariella vexata]
MAEPHYRYSASGRRSPTFNPARASLPLSVGYSSPYGGDIHAIPTARYDSSVPRRQGGTTTITTYNVTKDPVTRSSSVRDHSRNRHRPSTVDAAPHVKPIIVTTNHPPSRSSNPSSHASSATARASSPTRDAHRSVDETYYAQPASSIRSRSHNRHHSSSATMDNDEFYRLWERQGDERLRAPRPSIGTGADPYHPHSRQSMYVNTPRNSTSLVDFNPVDGYEYTKPSELARYDLDHDQSRTRASRRESIDRNYYRPSVSVVSSEVSRPERRGPPPTSSAIDRYNRSAAAAAAASAGIYDRPTVTLPSLPPALPPPPVDAARRSGLPDAAASPTVDRWSAGRARPVSLYQDAAPRMSQPDELYRARDDERAHRDHRERSDEFFRDDVVASRGFGLRPELVEPPQPDHRRHVETADRREYDDRRFRREHEDAEPRHRSDDDLDRARGPDERKGIEFRPRMEESRDRKDNTDSKIRDKVAAGLGAAAAAIGLGAVASKEEEDPRDGRGSPRRPRASEEDLEPVGAHAAARYKPRETDVVERKSSPREDPTIVEQKREARKERTDPRDGSSTDGSRDRNSHERERERTLERDSYRRETEARLSGPLNTRDSSPITEDPAMAPQRRRRASSAAPFNPTDTRGIMDLKAELAAIDGPEKPKEKERLSARERDRATDVDTIVSSSSERQSAASRPRGRDDESRGRELAPVDFDQQKQVRVVSPPRDKSEQKPIKGILKQPKEQFPEEPYPVREGVAPHKNDEKKKDVPPDARWTKISRKMVNPEALTIGKERYEVRDDFVIVLRVLSKEEIQGYATATAQIREKRRREYERENEGRSYDDRDRGDDEEERRRRHRHRRERGEEDDDRKDRDRDYDRDRGGRTRRHKYDADVEEEERRSADDYLDHGSHHTRSHSHRDRD